MGFRSAFVVRDARPPKPPKALVAHAIDLLAGRDGLHHIVQAGAGFVVRVSWNSLSLRTRHGKPFDLAGRLKRLGKAEWGQWQAIAHTAEGMTVPVRILARRKPPEAIAREIERITGKAARRGRTRRSGKPDRRSLISARYTVVATSLDEPAGQILDLYALRWQIEIAFKRLKSLLLRLRMRHLGLLRNRHYPKVQKL